MSWTMAVCGLGLSLCVTGCDLSNLDCDEEPVGGLLAHWEIDGERLATHVSNEDGVDDVLDLFRGRVEDDDALVGAVVCTEVGWNCGWNFHLDADTIEIADRSDTLCIDSPSDIEDECHGRGRQMTFCAGRATLLDVLDCRDGDCRSVR